MADLIVSQATVVDRLPNIVELKNKFDFKNLFHTNQNIGPTV